MRVLKGLLLEVGCLLSVLASDAMGTEVRLEIGGCGRRAEHNERVTGVSSAQSQSAHVLEQMPVSSGSMSHVS